MDSLITSGALWYASRATGVVSLLLLTAVVLLGILGNRGVRLPGLPRFATPELHRSLSLLSVVFLAVHIASVVVDPYVTIGWVETVVPWTGTYRPFWVGLGAVALDLVIALIVTSLVRVRMGRRSWRVIHWLAYAAWPAALAHGLGAGTDLSSGWFLPLVIGLAGMVAGAAGWRLALARSQIPRAAQAATRLRRPAPTEDSPTPRAATTPTGPRS